MQSLLLWLAAAQTTGLFAADRGLVGQSTAVAVVLLGLVCVVWHRGARGRAALAILLSFGAGVMAATGQLERADRNLVSGSRDVTLEARVCDVRRTARTLGLALCGVRRAGVDDACAQAADAEPPLPERLWLSARWSAPEAAVLEALPPGARLRARLRVRRLEGIRNPGGSSWAGAQRRRGLGGAAALVDPALLVRLVEVESEGLPSAVSNRIFLQRRRIAARLKKLGQGGALLAALAVGDRSGLEPATGHAIRALGLGHLLAVSGLHLALLTGLGFALLRAVGVRIGPLARRLDVRAWALVGGAIAATGYALLTGWDVPVQRALVFVWALTLGWLTARTRSPGHALALAAVIVLADRPEALFEAGGQLSFSATATLLLACPTADATRAGLARWLRGALSTTMLAVGATAPLLAIHAMPSTPAGLLWNLAAVPWTALVLLPAAIVSALLASLAAGAWPDAILWAFASVAEASLGAAVALAQSQPTWPVVPPPAWYAVGLAVCLVWLATRTPRLGVRAALVLSALVCIRTAPAPPVGPSAPRIVALDVGQGDSILVQGEEGAILVDGGRAVAGRQDLGRDAVLPALRALGVSRLEAVVVSHADLDHRGGLAAVLKAVPVDALWLPAGAENDSGLGDLLSLAERRGIARRALAAGDAPLRVGDLVVETLWPQRSAERRHWSRNDRSLVLRVQVADDRVLLTGDVGADVERVLIASGVDVSADVLKLPHHGSRTSSTPEFLAAVGAEVLLLSAPCGGRSGLPDARLLERLRAETAALAWTGRDGASTVVASRAGRPRRLLRWAPERSCVAPARSPPPVLGLCSTVGGE
jgi:competence protein ComEC